MSFTNMTPTTLTENRYRQVAPTTITSSGVSISCPIYISPTRDQTKALLNAFRRAKQNRGSVVEEELGMNEENLRYALFTRNGLPERLILKLQRLTGYELVTRDQIEATQNAWLTHLFS